MFELTGALSHVLPIMISVVVSKWVGDALGKEGIYSVWIAMRSYPWLPPTEYRDNGQTAASIMKSADSLVVIHDNGDDGFSDVVTIKELGSKIGTLVNGEKLEGVGATREITAKSATITFGSYDVAFR